MGNGSGVSRGDRNRNARLARLRQLHAVVTTGQAWDPHIAAGGQNPTGSVTLAA